MFYAYSAKNIVFVGLTPLPSRLRFHIKTTFGRVKFFKKNFLKIASFTQWIVANNRGAREWRSHEILEFSNEISTSDCPKLRVFGKNNPILKTACEKITFWWAGFRIISCICEFVCIFVCNYLSINSYQIIICNKHMLCSRRICTLK